MNKIKFPELINITYHYMANKGISDLSEVDGSVRQADSPWGIICSAVTNTFDSKIASIIRSWWIQSWWMHDKNGFKSRVQEKLKEKVANFAEKSKFSDLINEIECCKSISSDENHARIKIDSKDWQKLGGCIARYTDRDRFLTSFGDYISQKYQCMGFPCWFKCVYNIINRNISSNDDTFWKGIIQVLPCT